MQIINNKIFSNSGLIKYTGINNKISIWGELNTFGRPLRVTWDHGIGRDLQAFRYVNAEAELTRILGENIARELDREIFWQLRTPIYVSSRGYSKIRII